MRDKIVALVMCGLLAMTLFACGEKRGVANDSDVLGDENRYTNGTTNGTDNRMNSGNSGSGTNRSMSGSNNGTADSRRNNGSTNGTYGGYGSKGTNGNNADQSDVMGDSAIRGNTLNPANGSADRTATWEQMLENGRVHDTDGYLFDGENSHWA